VAGEYRCCIYGLGLGACRVRRGGTALPPPTIESTFFSLSLLLARCISSFDTCTPTFVRDSFDPHTNKSRTDLVDPHTNKSRTTFVQDLSDCCRAKMEHLPYARVFRRSPTAYRTQHRRHDTNKRARFI
jgi:hypothetical protein